MTPFLLLIAFSANFRSNTYKLPSRATKAVSYTWNAMKNPISTAKNSYTYLRSLSNRLFSRKPLEVPKDIKDTPTSLTDAAYSKAMESMKSDSNWKNYPEQTQKFFANEPSLKDLVDVTVHKFYGVNGGTRESKITLDYLVDNMAKEGNKNSIDRTIDALQSSKSPGNTFYTANGEKANAFNQRRDAIVKELELLKQVKETKSKLKEEKILELEAHQKEYFKDMQRTFELNEMNAIFQRQLNVEKSLEKPRATDISVAKDTFFELQRDMIKENLI